MKNKENKSPNNKKFNVTQLDEFTTENLQEGLHSRLKFTETKTDKIAQFLTEKSGSMGFLIANAILFLVWICWNLNVIPGLTPFDPFPFGLLTMIVSLVAIFLAIIVLISQNRQGKIADIRQQVDLEINVRAENEVTKILIMLEEIQKEMGICSSVDKELEEMKERTNIEDIHKKLEAEEKEKLEDEESEPAEN